MSLEQSLYEMINLRRMTLGQLARCQVETVRAMLEESLADLDECIAEIQEQIRTLS